jgi:NitT/TauT family transport system permease protein
MELDTRKLNSKISEDDSFFDPADADQIKPFEKKSSWIHQFVHSNFLLKLFILLALIISWQLIALYIHKNVENGNLLFPTIVDTFSVWFGLLETGKFWGQIVLTFAVLALCSLIGIVLGFFVAAFCISTRIGHLFLEMVAPPMSSLPAVALISAAILAFTSNLSAMIFVVSNAVFWSVLSSTHAGFTHVPLTLRRVGKNYGLTNFGIVYYVLLPAALPAILTGIRIGIARAFQAFVAVELVLGAVYGEGALGFFIQEAKNSYQPPEVYAGLFTLMFISSVLDNQLFGLIERKTIVKWGMKS